MKLLSRLAIVAVALVGIVAASVAPAAAIVGGRAAAQPYAGMAAMSINFPGLGTGACGGILFHSRFIMTAAHCVSDQLAAPNPVAMPGANITARIGSIDRTKGGVVATGKQVYLHPDWFWGMPTGRPTSDLALVELDRDVRLPPMHVTAFPVAESGPVRMIGWGLTTFPPAPGTGLPTILQERDTTRLANAACVGGGVGPAEMCVGAGGCFGDSGGPALRTMPNPSLRPSWMAVGVASRETSGTDPCGQPSIYTDLTYAPFRTWILTTIATRQVQPCTCPRIARGPTDVAMMSALKLNIIR